MPHSRHARATTRDGGAQHFRGDASARVGAPLFTLSAPTRVVAPRPLCALLGICIHGQTRLVHLTAHLGSRLHQLALVAPHRGEDAKARRFPPRHSPTAAQPARSWPRLSTTAPRTARQAVRPRTRQFGPSPNAILSAAAGASAHSIAHVLMGRASTRRTFHCRPFRVRISRTLSALGWRFRRGSYWSEQFSSQLAWRMVANEQDS